MDDVRLRILIIGIIVAISYAIFYFLYRNEISTNNATVECEITDIVAEINGTIDHISFTENDHVEKNATIVALEDSLQFAEAARKKAELDLSVSRHAGASDKHKILVMETFSGIENKKAESKAAHYRYRSSLQTVNESKMQLQRINVELEYLLQVYNRDKKLIENSTISMDVYNQSKRNYLVRLAERDALTNSIESLKLKSETDKLNFENSERAYTLSLATQVDTINASKSEVTFATNAVEVSESEYKLATLNLDRTKIRARRTGIVTNKSVSSGDYVEIGQPIASIVSCQGSAWIEANFKETQIEKISTGQVVDISIDTYPGVIFKGEVDSISNGSGSIFSVLPPENATGNFTKVVKRFPVKIKVKHDHAQVLRAGMSAYVTIFTENVNGKGLTGPSLAKLGREVK